MFISALPLLCCNGTVCLKDGCVHQAFLFHGKFIFALSERFLISFQTLQAAFFFLSLVNDVFGTKAMEPSKRGSLQKFLDVVFASIGFPGATVSILYIPLQLLYTVFWCF